MKRMRKTAFGSVALALTVGAGALLVTGAACAREQLSTVPPASYEVAQETRDATSKVHVTFATPVELDTLLEQLAPLGLTDVVLETSFSLGGSIFHHSYLVPEGMSTGEVVADFSEQRLAFLNIEQEWTTGDAEVYGQEYASRLANKREAVQQLLHSRNPGDSLVVAMDGDAPATVSVDQLWRQLGNDAEVMIGPAASEDAVQGVVEQMKVLDSPSAEAPVDDVEETDGAETRVPGGEPFCDRAMLGAATRCMEEPGTKFPNIGLSVTGPSGRFRAVRQLVKWNKPSFGAWDAYEHDFKLRNYDGATYLDDEVERGLCRFDRCKPKAVSMFTDFPAVANPYLDTRARGDFTCNTDELAYTIGVASASALGTQPYETIIVLKNGKAAFDNFKLQAQWGTCHATVCPGDFAWCLLTPSVTKSIVPFARPLAAGTCADRGPVPDAPRGTSWRREAWRGEYYDNMNLSGSPKMIRGEDDLGDATGTYDGIAVAWGGGSPSPGCGIPADRFSARWTRNMWLEKGTYELNVRSDDGVRIWIDGVLVLDEWHDSPANRYVVFPWIGTRGRHDVKIEYFENGGNAFLTAEWRYASAESLTCPRR